MSTLLTGLGDAWSAFATFFPKLLGFLLILLIGWLIAKGVSKGLKLLLTRTGFPKLIEKSGLGSVLARTQLDPGDLLVKLVYYFILLITLQWAFSAFGTENPVSQLLNQIIAYLPRIGVAILLVVITAAIGNVVRNLVRSALGSRSYAPLLGTVAYVFLLALGAIAALDQLGIATTVTLPVLVTVLGTVGGILIVGVGGGLIRPMQQRWDGWLGRLDRELSADRGTERDESGTSGQH